MLSNHNSTMAKEWVVEPPPKQVIGELTNIDESELTKRRNVIEKYLSPSSSDKYKSVAGKLGLLRALIEQKVFDSTNTYELQCMGIIFGDAFVQELDMHWIIVEDEMGRDPAIRLGNSSIIMYPMTMISKRIEREEEIDVFELFNGLVENIKDLEKTAD